MPAKRSMMRLAALATRAEAARPRGADECPPWIAPEVWASRLRSGQMMLALVGQGPEPEGVTDEEREYAESVVRMAQMVELPPDNRGGTSDS